MLGLDSSCRAQIFQGRTEGDWAAWLLGWMWPVTASAANSTATPQHTSARDTPALYILAPACSPKRRGQTPTPSASCSIPNAYRGASWLESAATTPSRQLAAKFESGLCLCRFGAPRRDLGPEDTDSSGVLSACRVIKWESSAPPRSSWCSCKSSCQCVRYQCRLAGRVAAHPSLPRRHDGNKTPPKDGREIPKGAVAKHRLRVRRGVCLRTGRAERGIPQLLQFRNPAPFDQTPGGEDGPTNPFALLQWTSLAHARPGCCSMYATKRERIGAPLRTWPPPTA